MLTLRALKWQPQVFYPVCECTACIQHGARSVFTAMIAMPTSDLSLCHMETMLLDKWAHTHTAVCRELWAEVMNTAWQTTPSLSEEGKEGD